MRISKKIVDETDTLEDLITKITTTKEGYTISGIGTPEEFKSRLEKYEYMLSKELPELTTEEILKFDALYHRFKDSVYSWYGFDTLLAAIEYKHLKK